MGRRTLRALCIALLVTGCASEGGSGPADGFRFPLAGTLGDDFFYSTLVDHQAGGGIEDYDCGTATYDGHTGTDVFLPSFAAMDDGVEVVAAAPGTVVDVHDGEPDRNTSWDGQSGLGNYVAISHDGGLVTWYGHLTNGSVAVDEGDVVAEGDALGLVGSSGRSSAPHLHFEVQDGVAVRDPFAGACSEPDSLWRDQEDYDTEFRVVSTGFTAQTLDYDAVLQPPPVASSFSTGDSTIWFYVLVLNVEAGTESEFRFYRPNGDYFDTITLSHGEDFPASWWWVYYPIAGNFTQAGTWQLDYAYEGDVRETTSFEIVSAFEDSIAGVESDEPGADGFGL